VILRRAQGKRKENTSGFAGDQGGGPRGRHPRKSKKTGADVGKRWRTGNFADGGKKRGR